MSQTRNRAEDYIRGKIANLHKNKTGSKNSFKMKKNGMSEVIVNTVKILHDYHLCDYCLGRMFASKLKVVSHKKLGEKIRKKLGQKIPKSCYICKNLMDDLDSSISKILQLSSEYEFSSFLIGAVIKPSLLDRDDQIRSKFKLRGIVGIKNDITREMGKKFGRKTRTKVDYLNPDIVITIDFKKEQYEIKPKAIILQGRYAKNARGIPQKQTPCKSCLGRGCFVCDFHGISEYDSVEGRIAKFLYEKFDAPQIKITWLGSEDESSLVLGKGRPFFVKVHNPRKRNVTLPKKIKLDKISILNLHEIERIPNEPLRFKTEVSIEVETENEISDDSLMVLEALKNTEISSEEGSYKNPKRIYSVKFKKTSPRTFVSIINMDGGIPIKRLVSGGRIEPNLSMILNNQCHCKIFDFHKIFITK